MDNDIKVNEIRLSSREITELLKDELDLVAAVDHHFSYSIENEYPKSKRNMVRFMWRNVWRWLLLCFVVVIGIAFGMIKFVRHADERISVDIEEAAELNLGDLFEKVNELDLKIQKADEARKEFVDKRNERLMKIENRHASDLKSLEESWTKASAEIRSETKNRRKIVKKEKKAMELIDIRKKEIEDSYRTSLLELDPLNSMIAEYDKEISEFIRQRDEFDRERVQENEKQKAALDSSRILFEKEKQKLIDEYEARLEMAETAARENLQEYQRQELSRLREEKAMLLAERKSFVAEKEFFLESLCSSVGNVCDGIVLNFAPTQSGGIYVALRSREKIGVAMRYNLSSNCQIFRGESLVATANICRNLDSYYLMEIRLADSKKPLMAGDRIFFK